MSGGNSSTRRGRAQIRSRAAATVRRISASSSLQEISGAEAENQGIGYGSAVRGEGVAFSQGNYALKNQQSTTIRHHLTPGSRLPLRRARRSAGSRGQLSGR